MEALLSDLVFKHALRIRLQGGERNGASADGNSPSNQPNLVGTINNHVTTDLTNVTEAKDFVPIGMPPESCRYDKAERTKWLAFPCRLSCVSSCFIKFWVGGK